MEVKRRKIKSRSKDVSSDPKQSLGTDKQDYRHHREDHHCGGLGPVGRDQRLRDADQEPRDDGAEQVAEAAERDHDEGDAEHVHAHAGESPRIGAVSAPAMPAR